MPRFVVSYSVAVKRWLVCRETSLSVADEVWSFHTEKEALEAIDEAYGGGA